MIGLDSYSIPARLFPAVLVMLPVGFAVAELFPQELIVWGAGSGVVSTTGLAFLMTELVRSRGRALQERLYDELGAKPTTILLRHRDNRIDPTTKTRYHRCLGSLVPDVCLPTAEQEAADTTAADEQYDSCVKYLLEQTRDRKSFRLVFKELVSYGMIRNLRGMRPAAITIAIVGTFVCAVRALAQGMEAIDASAAVAGIVSASMLAVWIVRLNDQWVKDAAFDYAKTLLASCDKLCPGDC